MCVRREWQSKQAAAQVLISQVLRRWAASAWHLQAVAGAGRGSLDSLPVRDRGANGTADADFVANDLRSDQWRYDSA